MKIHLQKVLLNQKDQTQKACLIYNQVVRHRNMLRWNCSPSRMHNTWTCAQHKANNPIAAHSHIVCHDILIIGIILEKDQSNSKSMPHIYTQVVGHRNMLRWNRTPSRMHNTWTCAQHKAYNPIVAHSHIQCATTFQSSALFSKKTKVARKECLIYNQLGRWTQEYATTEQSAKQDAQFLDLCISQG